MTYRCARCDFRTDDNDQAGAHMRETSHKRCIVCHRSLSREQPQTCTKCVGHLRATLADIEFAYAMLDDVINNAGFHSGTLPGGAALVLAADGSVQSPQTPNMYTEPVIVEPTAHLERPEIIGHEEPVKWWKLDRATGIRHKEIYTASTTHPEYVEERIPSDGREHLKDHWQSDPTPVIAVLEYWERYWRLTFEHRPASDELVTVVGCMGYLNKWLDRAADEHPEFDQFVIDMRDLHGKLTHVAGTTTKPVFAEASCFDCTGALIRPYRPPTLPASTRIARAMGAVAAARRARDDERNKRQQERAECQRRKLPRRFWPPRIPPLTGDEERAIALPILEGRHDGDEHYEGLPDVWECRRCHREYLPAEYMLAVRAVLESRALAQ